MSTVDASVVTSALVADDVHFAVSRPWLQSWVASGNTIYAPTLILAEVAGAIARRTGDPAAGRRGIIRVRRLSTLSLVALDERLAEDAAQLAADLRLRGADAVYVAVARRFGVPLVTWDQEQLQRGAAVVATRPPATI